MKGKSASAKALREALAENITLYHVIGKMSRPEQVVQATVGSVWYSKDGGAAGSNSILHIEKTRARELVIDADTYKRRPVIWAYSFDAKTGELTLSKGVATRVYKLEKRDEFGSRRAAFAPGCARRRGWWMDDPPMTTGPRRTLFTRPAARRVRRRGARRHCQPACRSPACRQTPPSRSSACGACRTDRRGGTRAQPRCRRHAPVTSRWCGWRVRSARVPSRRRPTGSRGW